MHRYARTERDLRWLAVNFSAGNIQRGIPERLECLAAWHRTNLEAEKARQGQAHSYEEANAAYAAAIGRMLAAGVGEPEGDFTFSPCCGPDDPHIAVPTTRA